MNAQDLKNSILQLAIQGKLVEQRKEEGTAKELIEEIKAEKERLIKEKKIKKEKPLAEITEDEVPFEIPESWEWVRFGDLGSYRKGPFGSALTKAIFVPKGYDTIKVYEQKNAIQKNVNLGDYYITREYFESKMKGFELFPGDIIVSCAGTIGETYVMPDKFEQGIINQALMQMKIMPQICIDYFLIYFDFILKKTARQSSKGSAIKNIPPFEELKSYLVPMPPLAEQKRIVAKIEELMPYIEKYGEAHSKLEKFNKKFPEDMQKSILQYAIQGKLVEQREEEGTAEELYKQIQEEKEKLIKDKKIKKEKPLAEITEDEIPFEIPESWRWMRLGNLFTVSTGLTPAKTNPLFHENGDIPWITSSQTGELKIEKANNFITKFAIESTNLKIYPKHTLLIAMYGQGKTRGQISELLIDATINQACAALENIVAEENLRKYILYFQIYNYDISRTGAEGSAQPNLNLDKIRNILVPLPPLAEQKRIVAKIEEMLPYCEQLVK